MAVLLLPTTESPYQKQRLRLDGRDYVFSIAYNQRAERWSVSIADAQEVPILAELRLVANWPLLYRYRYDPRVPPGELVAATTDGSQEPPGLTELGEGRRVELTYFEAAELTV